MFHTTHCKLQSPLERQFFSIVKVKKYLIVHQFTSKQGYEPSLINLKFWYTQQFYRGVKIPVIPLMSKLEKAQGY